MVWDCREAARWDADRGVAVNSPVMVIEDAHKYVNNAAESARKRRKQVCSSQAVQHTHGQVAFVSWHVQAACCSVLPLLHDLLHVNLPLHNQDSSYAVPEVSSHASGAQNKCRGRTVSLHSSCTFLLSLSLVTISRQCVMTKQTPDAAPSPLGLTQTCSQCLCFAPVMSTNQKNAGPMVFTATDAFGFVFAGGE